jgi:hypothetical protein
VHVAVANLLNLEVELLFFYTTSTYFETDAADPPTMAADKRARLIRDASSLQIPASMPRVRTRSSTLRGGDAVEVRFRHDRREGPVDPSPRLGRRREERARPDLRDAQAEVAALVDIRRLRLPLRW